MYAVQSSPVIEKQRQTERWAEEEAAWTEMTEVTGKYYGITT